MRILFVAMANSVHVARWVAQLQGLEWDLHLFPSMEAVAPHRALRGITVHDPIHSADSPHESVTLRGLRLPRRTAHWLRTARARRDVLWRARRLAQLIDRLRPDVVHSMEFQHGGYLALAASELTRRKFPRWLATNWGNDIYLFGRLTSHQPRIRAILGACDYYSCEAERDVQLARVFGFRGESWPVMPNTGGLDLAKVSALRQLPISARRVIAIKGYQGLMGRALVALEAVRRCAQDLREYTIVVYSGGTEEMRPLCDLLRAETGLDVRLAPELSHDGMLSLFSSARVYLGLSISDGASTSMLEAIALGAFPIQSNTASADEWIVPGENGFIVPPEDPAVAAEALRRAVTDDALVDRAGETNAVIAARRLDATHIRPAVIRLYGQMVRGERLDITPAPEANQPVTATGRPAGSTPRPPYRLDHVRTAMVFGAGANRDLARELCGRAGWRINGWIDNDRRLWGQVIDGLPVRAPSGLGSSPADLVIIASDVHHDAIAEQLEGIGMVYGENLIGYRSAVRVGAMQIQVG
jgi:glycosyltransferase involved in cell wall biosynthesis